MKRLLIALLLLAAPALAEVDATQIKKKADGGVKADAARAAYVGVYRGTSAPGTPLAGQFWCDTTVSPCMLKVYNGSTWDGSPVNLTIPTQTDLSSLPATPTDGQIFLNKSNHNLYVYDSTTTAWYGFQTVLWTQGVNVTDLPSGTVLAPPGGVPLAAKTVSCGAGATTGTYSYKDTLVNSTGGETTPSGVSNTITYTATTDCTDLSTIWTGGTGTTARRIYRSKVNAPGGPWYYVGTISDNTTATFRDANVTNANASLLAPEVNFSGAMPANWVVTNESASTVSGGCGTTASQTFRCKVSHLGGSSGAPTATTDTVIRANRDISSYVGGNYTIQARFLEVGNQEPPTYNACSNANNVYPKTFFGIRYGTLAYNPRYWFGDSNTNFGGTFCAATTGNPFGWGLAARTTASGAAAVANAGSNGWPPTYWIKTTSPVWMRLVKRGNILQFYHSVDGTLWSALNGCASTSVSDAACAIDLSAANPAGWTSLEIPIGMMMATSASTTDNWIIEWDSFSIEVD